MKILIASALTCTAFVTAGWSQDRTSAFAEAAPKVERREWHDANGRAIAELEESLLNSGAAYHSRLSIRSEKLGRFELDHWVDEKSGDDRQSLRELGSEWEAELSIHINLPKGAELPPDGDFDQTMALLGLEGTTITYELTTSDGARWQFEESHESPYPKQQADLVQAMKAGGSDAVLIAPPARIIDLAARLAAPNGSQKDLEWRYHALGEALLAMNAAGRAGKANN